MLGQKIHYGELDNYLIHEVGVEWVNMMLKKKTFHDHCLKELERSTQQTHTGEKLIDYGNKKFSKKN